MVMKTETPSPVEQKPRLLDQVRETRVMSRLNLNPEQIAAATHGAGPALVLAGPGTGKTTTLVGRYAHLVNTGVAPERVFVSTFTRKAAHELRFRIQRSAGINPDGLPIGTFHSYCFHLTGSPEVIQHPRRFVILRECMSDWKGDLSAVVDAIDRFKDSLVSPEDARAQASRTRNKSDRDEQLRIADAYSCYQRCLAKQGLADFGDLVWRSIRLLRDHPPDGSQFDHLLIDEYQDINPAQDELIKSLLTHGGQLWVVGDDDQAIYGWRGSDVRYMTSFTRTYTGATTYRLKRNYRSSRVIVQMAQALVSQNKRRLSKPLVAAGGVVSRRICVAPCDHEEDEASWVASAVQKLIRSGVHPEEIAILLRTNFQTVEFERALSREGIKFVVRGAGSFWDLPVVRALMAAIWRAGKIPGNTPWLGPAYLVSILDGATQPAGDVTFRVLVDRLVAAAISARPRSMPLEQRIQWDGAAKRLGDESHRFENMDAFMVHCRALTAQGARSEDENEAVVLSTIHQAKGLEWEAVFLGGFEAELLPHKLARDCEEERRLAYVAVTRARSFLTMTWAAKRGGAKRDKSPFLAELLAGAEEAQLDRRGQPLQSNRIRRREKVAHRSQTRRTESRRIRPRDEQNKPAVRVRHPNFGDGTVKSVRSNKYVVQFDRHGEKTILSGYLEILG